MARFCNACLKWLLAISLATTLLIPGRWVNGSNQSSLPPSFKPLYKETNPLILRASHARIQQPPGELQYGGIDFGNSRQPVRIKIHPVSKRINGGKPIVIKFYPGDDCEFGEQRACVYAYRASNGQNIIFITVHSGSGAEAETFRNAVEGTGYNQAGLPLKKVLGRMGNLEGAQVSISQGDIDVDGLQLAGLGRVPASGLDEYFNVPVDRSLEIAAGYNETLGWAVDPGVPLIVFETCGWRMRGEPGVKAVSSTSGSVYLGVIATDTP